MSTLVADPAAQLRAEAHHWLLRLTSGHATSADAKAFQGWCAQSAEHARAFTQARQLWQAIEPAEQLLRRAEAAVQPAANAPTYEAPVAAPAPRRFGRRAFLGGAIAASVAVVLARPSLHDGLFGLGADFYTAVGEQRRVDLVEGVVLELNTQTRISQRTSSSTGATIEVLSGEVEVQARTPVRVLAGNAQLLTNGALFNVRAIDGNVCVTCLEGSVQVQYHGRYLSLPQGQQLTYSAQQQGQPSTFDPAVVMAWRQQMLVFNDVTLASVIDEINRYRPGMIVLMNDELGRRKVQARFSLNQLGEVAVLIRDAYGATITELPGGVMLVS